eukprot:TRINITY_DN8624_c0_g1_i1.p1 TRINITY_DN8624_c0_g1~~TRINITY_DN8624_c0_g1_i1.p1  ORF type:complete len:294 (-),score=36.58 TRINITY_DN8624_c0_g1_i1:180-992(-)
MDVKWDPRSLADSIRIGETDDKVATTHSNVGGPALASPSTSNSFAVQFQVIKSRDGDGGGMVLGIADAETALARGCVAGWGLNLYSGMSVFTGDVFDYGEDQERVWDTPGKVVKTITGCTVTMDVCRMESCITYTINNGPAVKVPVFGLATCVRPWVLFGRYSGDSVKLVSMTERSQLVVTVECHWNSCDGVSTVTCTNFSGEELATKRVTESSKQTLKDCFPHISDIPIAFVSLVTRAGKELDALDKDTVLAELFAEEIHGGACSAANE